MLIPSKNTAQFVREVADACLVSQSDRIQRGLYYRNYFMFGSEKPDAPAAFNRTFTHIDDLESTLYSPIALRLKINDPDLPNVVSEAKGRAGASRLRIHARRSKTDSMTSAAVGWALVKGKTFIKQQWKRTGFAPSLVMPEAMGVLKENHDCLDENMEAFVHSMLLTPHELRRIVWNRPDREDLLKKLQGESLGQLYPMGVSDAGNNKQVVIGGLYPFQPASAPPVSMRGVVDWMGGPNPVMSPTFFDSLVRMDEVWIWDDDRDDWATFQIIGDHILWPTKIKANFLAFNPVTGKDHPDLRGQHMFCEFCPDPTENYFWGRSEIPNVWLLQEFINKRVVGINRMLRKEEEPSTKFTGTTGVNQMTLARYRSPGGYWSDMSPNAKIEDEARPVPPDAWVALHEWERMFDVVAGKPPVTQGRGDQGVRAQGHAQTLITMASPRFKDRALLVERDCESMYSLMLEIARVHDPKKMIAWVPQAQAGSEASEIPAGMVPPAPGQVPVKFGFADIEDDATVTIDSHSASPIFAMEAKQLIFDLFKIGAASAEDVIEHVDAPDPEGLITGVERRNAEKAAEIAKLSAADPKGALKLVEGKKR